MEKFEDEIRNACDVAELESNEGLRDELKRADIVLAYDTELELRHVIFGRERLKQIAETKLSKNLRVLKFKYDTTPRLEFLCGALLALKGSHEYPGFGQTMNDSSKRT